MTEQTNEKGRGIATLSVKDCARCSGAHEGLVFEKLDLFSRVGDFTMVYWAMCPDALQPVMLGVRPPALPTDPVDPSEPVGRLGP